MVPLEDADEEEVGESRPVEGSQHQDRMSLSQMQQLTVANSRFGSGHVVRQSFGERRQWVLVV
jgi:hypothetical protein